MAIRTPAHHMARKLVLVGSLIAFGAIVLPGGAGATPPRPHGLDPNQWHLPLVSNFRPCTFNGDGSGSLTGVTPGMSIAISCTGFPPDDTVSVAEASPLLFTADVGHQRWDIDNTDGESVLTDGSGNLNATFVVPASVPFSIGDPSATCPPSQDQINSGLERCVLILADYSPGDGSIEQLSYAGQPTPGTPGYWLAGADGGVFTFGSAHYAGSMAGHPLNAPIVGITYDERSGGYWEVAADGGVFAFGGAPFKGSLAGTPLASPIVGLTSDRDSDGYWLVAADGEVFSFGGAPLLGSIAGQPLDAPIVALVYYPQIRAYWEVGADGGVFTSRYAPFFGSLGGQHLNAPVVGMAYDRTAGGVYPAAGGYRQAAADGGVFAFHDSFLGSMASHHLNAPIVGIANDPLTGGYWEVGADGGVFSFGAPFEGSMAGTHLASPIVGMATNLVV